MFGWERWKSELSIDNGEYLRIHEQQLATFDRQSRGVVAVDRLKNRYLARSI